MSRPSFHERHGHRRNGPAGNKTVVHLSPSFRGATRAHEIATAQQLETLCDALQYEKYIALSFKTAAGNSYQYICILQLSTHENDYIIDTILLRKQSSLLQEICSNPSITKIVYDANFVISMLHNLLHIDIVNLCDICELAKQMNLFSKNSFDLARALCHSTSSYNRALESTDWSNRPISPEMWEYAQEETSLMISVYQALVPVTQSSSPIVGNGFIQKSNRSPDSPHNIASAVPDSIEEIYQLSNANRKRNKEKKKLKGENAKMDAVFTSREESTDIRGGEPQLQDPKDFMKKIGWVVESEGNSSALSPKPRVHRRTKSGDHGSDRKPKRRGKRHRKQASCTFPVKGGFPFEMPRIH